MVNRVADGLWMGGHPPPGSLVGQHFDCLVLCAQEFQIPDCFSGVQVAQAVMDDSGKPMSFEEAKQAVRAAGKVVRWLDGGLRVLVTCYAGRNRSGLVCALALCKGPARMRPEEAVRAVRRARGPYALVNPYFMEFVKAYCGRAPGA